MAKKRKQNFGDDNDDDDEDEPSLTPPELSLTRGINYSGYGQALF